MIEILQTYSLEDAGIEQCGVKYGKRKREIRKRNGSPKDYFIRILFFREKDCRVFCVGSRAFIRDICSNAVSSDLL